MELLNTGSAPVDLNGLVLTDKLNSNSQFVFPSHVLQPGETVLVFCDDGNANAYGSPYHAPFKISSSGDTVMLCSENGTVIETVNVPALGANEVYMRDSAGNWSVSTQYTPGLANTAENHASLVGERELASDIEVTEIMADNATYAATASGAVYDYIEIHNKGGSGRFPERNVPFGYRGQAHQMAFPGCDAGAWRIPYRLRFWPGRARRERTARQLQAQRRRGTGRTRRQRGAD